MAYTSPPTVVTATIDQFEKLLNWCYNIGMCQTCSAGVTCAILQQASGNRSFRLPDDYGCDNRESCRKLARDNYMERPGNNEKTK